MAYPGEGYQMSNYGLKTFTPEETKEQWREHVEREHKCTTNHVNREPPKEIGDPGDVTYFGNNKEHTKTTTYDRSVRKCVDHYHIAGITSGPCEEFIITRMCAM